jgi:LacI family transcriptional regulator
VSHTALRPLTVASRQRAANVCAHLVPNDAIGRTVTKVTLKDIAERAGVHVSTASRALDPQKSSLVGGGTRARVRAAADELGYRGDALASGLRRGRTSTFGVVVADLGNPFIAPVVRGIENSLDGRGLMALVSESQDDHTRMSRVLDNLLSRRVDAIITTAARAGDERLLRGVAAQVPLVLAVRDLPDADLVAVTHDDERGGRLAAEHLLASGHRRVAQLRGPRDISNFHGRAEGFRRRLAESGAELLEVDHIAAHPILSEGRRLMERLFALYEDLPTAVFAHNDLMAFGALEALRAHGLACPQDLALIGYNDTQMTTFTAPPLTTIRLPGYELGRLAADAAIVLIENEGRHPPRLSLPPVLVPRE